MEPATYSTTGIEVRTPPKRRLAALLRLTPPHLCERFCLTGHALTTSVCWPLDGGTALIHGGRGGLCVAKLAF